MYEGLGYHTKDVWEGEGMQCGTYVMYTLGLRDIKKFVSDY